MLDLSCVKSGKCLLVGSEQYSRFEEISMKIFMKNMKKEVILYFIFLWIQTNMVQCVMCDKFLWILRPFWLVATLRSRARKSWTLLIIFKLVRCQKLPDQPSRISDFLVFLFLCHFVTLDKFNLFLEYLLFQGHDTYWWDRERWLWFIVSDNLFDHWRP